MDGARSIRIREHGTAGPRVVLLHGGPGSPGYLAPLARELSGSFRILEPFQRGSGQRASGGETLTVVRHVADLHDILESGGFSERPALVGHSFGAMLALAYAAAHPGRAASIALIGCGTFDPASRERLRETRETRTSAAIRRRLATLQDELPDPDERFRAAGNLLLAVDSHDLLVRETFSERCDARAFEETWADMLRLQDEGVYPAAFASIDAPVRMLHGAEDPHPGRMILESLRRYLPRIEYRELERCGHYPWLEKHAREEFLDDLREWLVRGPA